MSKHPISDIRCYNPDEFHKYLEERYGHGIACDISMKLKSEYSIPLEPIVRDAFEKYSDYMNSEARHEKELTFEEFIQTHKIELK